MDQEYFYNKIAAIYNCGAYSEDSYNNSVCEKTTTAGAPTALSGTGYDITIPLITGVLLIVVAAIILLKAKKYKKSK